MVKVLDSDSPLRLSLHQGTEEYVNFRKLLRQEKILEKSYTYYALLTAFILAGLVVSGYGIYIANTYLLITFYCLPFSFFMGQTAGLLHDGGHQAIFKKRLHNDIYGFIFAILTGVNYISWTYHHDGHHAHPNQEGKDRDLDIPYFFTEEHYEKRKMGKLQRYQAWFYFPLQTLVVYSTHAYWNFFYAIKEAKKGLTLRVFLQFFQICLSTSLWFVLPFLVFPLNKALFVVLVVPLTMSLYLANVFAPNHKAMPQLKENIKISFLEQQIITTRNIKTHPIIDFIYFGLNRQLEHHLLPSCPRNKLKLMTPHVKALCEKLNLPYTEVGVIDSFISILKEMNDIAKECERKQ